MRKLFLYMSMSMDGFLAGPNGELDWLQVRSDQELNDDIIALMTSADTGIIGYPTAKGMIPYWASVPNNPSASQEEKKLAQAINKIHSVVVSNNEVSLDIPEAELMVIKDDEELIKAVNKLKQQSGKDIGVPGGVRTAQKFTRLGLFDEYYLMVYPIAIGSGQPLFTGKTDLDLVSAKAYASGVLRLRYRPCPVKTI